MVALNIPIWHLLEKSQNILVAGAGGGYDVYAGLPLIFTLLEAGKRVHIANYSFLDDDFSQLPNDTTEKTIPTLLSKVQGELLHILPYAPEHYLADWFVKQGDPRPIWTFHNLGVQDLRACYAHLVRELKIDAIILIDGGVDSIMRGDEEGSGSILEDTISLAAIADLAVPVKLQVCLGFGTEVEEGLCHYSALENMSALAKAGGFYGTCSLVPNMPVFQRYESACRHAWDRPNSQKSHISPRIIPAVHGETGNFQMYPGTLHQHFLSPLMGIFWFFDANVVIKHNYLIKALTPSYGKEDARRRVMDHISFNNRPRRPRRKITY